MNRRRNVEPVTALGEGDVDGRSCRSASRRRRSRAGRRTRATTAPSTDTSTWVGTEWRPSATTVSGMRSTVTGLGQVAPRPTGRLRVGAHGASRRWPGRRRTRPTPSCTSPFSTGAGPRPGHAAVVGPAERLVDHVGRGAAVQPGLALQRERAGGRQLDERAIEALLLVDAGRVGGVLALPAQADRQRVVDGVVAGGVEQVGRQPDGVVVQRRVVADLDLGEAEAALARRSRGTKPTESLEDLDRQRAEGALRERDELARGRRGTGGPSSTSTGSPPSNRSRTSVM